MSEYLLISGGGTGIGLETAKLCLTKKWTPVLLGRRASVLKKASESLNSCPFLAVDLSKPSSKEILKTFLNRLDGSIVGVVNNAGVYRPSSIESSNEENWIGQYQINVLSALNLTQSALPYLKKSKGSVVNVTSTLGIRPIPNAGAYSASKAAMNSMTLSMALEFSEFKVRVNAVCPGIVNTPIHDAHREDVSEWKAAVKNMQPLGRVGEVSDIAPSIVLLLDPASSWTTGALLNIDGGILLNS